MLRVRRISISKGNAAGKELEGWRWIRKPGYSVAPKDDCPSPRSRCAMVRAASGTDPRDFGYITANISRD
jgi:hypothetical protein